MTRLPQPLMRWLVLHGVEVAYAMGLLGGLTLAWLMYVIWL